jgi:hypothetical protein
MSKAEPWQESDYLGDNSLVHISVLNDSADADILSSSLELGLHEGYYRATWSEPSNDTWNNLIQRDE